MSSIEDVISFWFGEPVTDDADIKRRIGRWFQGGASMDAEVRSRFGPLIEEAVGGGLRDWEGSSRGRLALVLLLDQFTRNAYRGDPRTHAGDPRAQRLALDAFQSGMAAELGLLERYFLAMPLLHSEDLAMHDALAPICEALMRETKPPLTSMAAGLREQTAKYREVIRRFGRFPHRNQLLGRETTPEEAAWLTDWLPTAAPAVSRDAK